MLSGLLLMLGLLPLALVSDFTEVNQEDDDLDDSVPADDNEFVTGEDDDFLDLLGPDGSDEHYPDDPDADTNDVADPADEVGDEVTVSTGDGTVFVVGGEGYVFGSEGDDTIQLGTDASTVFGYDGADQITGCDENNSYLDGGAGDDLIQGGDSDEIIMGGIHVEGTGESDDDVINGGGGNDDIRGGLGADTLLGGDGDDVINHKGVVAENTSSTGEKFEWHIDGEADTLDGGDGDDTLIFDHADTATGGEGADVFMLYSGGGEGSFAQITDFVPGEDLLQVHLNPDLAADNLVLDVQPSSDNADSVVTVNGKVIALLSGTPNATVDDIHVGVSEDVA